MPWEDCLCLSRSANVGPAPFLIPGRPSVGRPGSLCSSWKGCVSELYDSTAFLTDDRWWAILLTCAPRQVGRVVIATAVMVFLLAGRRLRDAFDHGGGGDRTRSAWPLVVAHLTAFAAFAALTVVVQPADPGVVAFGGTWAFAWFGMGAIALGTWIGAVLPPSFVRALGGAGRCRF